MAITLPVSLPPREAVAFFRRKGYKPSFSWEDVQRDEHARVFTVAKVARLDVLEDIRAACDRALAEGTAFAEFKRQLIPTLQEKGWWGVGRMRDPLDGKEKEVQLGSVRRLRTIYDTNLRTSYATGRWEQIQRTVASRPFLRYVGILDEAIRAQHRAWHGTVLRADDPWWRTHFPPNGWRCRCNVQQLSERDLTRYGYKVNPAAPPAPTVPYENGRTGEVRQVPVGVDPGFDYSFTEAAESAARYYAERITAAAPDVGAAAWAADSADLVAPLQRGYRRWVDELADAGAGGIASDQFTVGAIAPATEAFLRAQGRPARAAGIVVRARDAGGLRRKGAPDSTRIPELLSGSRAVVWDPARNELLHVVDVADGSAGVVAVSVPARGSAPLRVVATRVAAKAALEALELLSGSL